jgi:hypothetical protein
MQNTLFAFNVAQDVELEEDIISLAHYDAEQQVWVGTGNATAFFTHYQTGTTTYRATEPGGIADPRSDTDTGTDNS